MYFFNAGKGEQAWYWYLMTIVLVIIAYVIGQLPMSVAVMYQVQRRDDLSDNALNEFYESLDFSIIGMSSSEGIALALMMFLFAFLALYAGVRFLHKRNFLSLINWKERIDWLRIFWAWGFWMLFSITFELLYYYFEPENYSYNSPGISYLVLVLIAFTLIPIQSSFEELFFRSYLMQAIGFFSKSKWLAFFVIAILFASVHLSNPEIKEYGLWNMLPYYLIAGFFLGYITIMDDRIELALGVHAATNMFGSLFVTYEGAAMQTDSLFKTHEVQPIFLSGVFLLFGILFIIIASKKYGWQHPLKVFNNWEEAA